jgi:osmotically-inducible protein OsmY
MDDLELKQNVESELSWGPSVDAAQIGVAVKEGIVTLSGQVQSYSEKVVAIRAMARVAGVKAVVNDLELRLPSSSERSDEGIARAAVDALRWNVVPADRVKVKMSKGWVMLEGNVDWQFQKTAAEKAVRKL